MHLSVFFKLSIDTTNYERWGKFKTANNISNTINIPNKGIHRQKVTHMKTGQSEDINTWKSLNKHFIWSRGTINILDGSTIRCVRSYCENFIFVNDNPKMTGVTFLKYKVRYNIRRAIWPPLVHFYIGQLLRGTLTNARMAWMTFQHGPNASVR